MSSSRAAPAATKKRGRKVVAVAERSPEYHDFESLAFTLESPFGNEPGDDPEILDDDEWPRNGETKTVQPNSARKHLAVGCVNIHVCMRLARSRA